MKDIKKQMIVAELIQKELDGCLTDQEFNLLQSMLKEDKEVVAYYVKTIRAISAFSSNSIVPSLEPVEDEKFQVESFQSGIWKALAEQEKVAPAVQIPQEKQNDKPIQEIERQSVQIKINRSSLITLLLSAAAVLLFALIIRFVPSKSGVEVATLADSIKAKWADAGTSMGKGARLVTGSSGYLLREGIVQIEFDNQAKVTIESPAEFEIIAGDQVKLNYGRLYATVPQRAIGFGVQTASARIVDLGTEFGIQADVNGSAELHVIKGKVQLFTGSDGKSRISQMLMENTAVRYDAALNQVKNISIEKQAFVRQIDSKNGFIWRGQTKYNLADVVGGGDGFGKGRINFGIDHEGQTTLLDNIIAYTKPAPFASVSSNPFVDGVFVPYGPTQIDSSGQDVYDFGSTSGGFYLGILNGAWHKQRDNAVPRHTLRLGGLEYGTGEHSAIYIHANQGITFDLMAIREYTQMEIDKFTSVCGVSETYADYAEAIRKVRQYKNVKLPKASFYILVDGQERFIRNDITYLDGPAVISVDIAPQDRFLTLVTTESSDKNEGDWTLFGEPVLILQSE